ncbi:hypothetical protein CRYUN_Cryun32bG0072800 [Craigia yunnanensis]
MLAQSPALRSDVSHLAHGRESMKHVGVRPNSFNLLVNNDAAAGQVIIHGSSTQQVQRSTKQWLCGLVPIAQYSTAAHLMPTGTLSTPIPIVSSTENVTFWAQLTSFFGKAAVVLQSCNIQPRQPLPNQFNTITAQGKKDPNQNTGISIQKCSLTAFGNRTAKTYLGRPWKEYSTTVIMQSDIGAFLDPVGWKEWVAILTYQAQFSMQNIKTVDLDQAWIKE